VSAGPAVEACAVDPVLAAELPGLALLSTTVAAPAAGGGASRDVADRLDLLAGRWTGARALGVRREPVPLAYRVLARQVGLDPDEQRTPIEQAVLDRLRRGGFRARGAVARALLLALVETGVPVSAFDDEQLTGPLELRATSDGVVVADAARPVAALLGEPAADVRVGPRTRTIRLAALGAPGVPRLVVEEALWTAVEAL
jgi:hypothetical protein